MSRGRRLSWSLARQPRVQFPLSERQGSLAKPRGPGSLKKTRVSGHAAQKHKRLTSPRKFRRPKLKATSEREALSCDL